MCLIDTGTRILHGRGDCRKPVELRFCDGRDEFGKSRLADAGRPMEDDRSEAVRFDGATQLAAAANDVILTDVFVESGRPQAHRQRGIGCRQWGCRSSCVFEQHVGVILNTDDCRTNDNITCKAPQTAGILIGREQPERADTIRCRAGPTGYLGSCLVRIIMRSSVPFRDAFCMVMPWHRTGCEVRKKSGRDVHPALSRVMGWQLAYMIGQNTQHGIHGQLVVGPVGHRMICNWMYK